MKSAFFFPPSEACGRAAIVIKIFTERKTHIFRNCNTYFRKCWLVHANYLSRFRVTTRVYCLKLESTLVLGRVGELIIIDSTDGEWMCSYRYRTRFFEYCVKRRSRAEWLTIFLVVISVYLRGRSRRDWKFFYTFYYYRIIRATIAVRRTIENWS